MIKTELLIVEKNPNIPDVSSLTTIRLSRNEIDILGHISVYGHSYGMVFTDFSSLIQKSILSTDPDYQEIPRWYLSTRGSLVIERLKIENNPWFEKSVRENNELKTKNDALPQTGGM